MTEWEGSFVQKNKGKAHKEATIKKTNSGLAKAGVSDDVRQQIMARALAELEKNTDKPTEEQTRQMMIQTIAETRMAMGQSVDMAAISKLVDEMGHAVAQEEEEERLARENEEIVRMMAAEEKKRRKENQIAWYWWVVIAVVSLPLTIPILRITILMLGRAGRAVF